MDISALIKHPAAGKAAMAIPNTADPAALADLYARLITYGDYQSHCRALGLEWHLRTAAQVAFHRQDVLAALQAMETALDGRKAAHRRILRQGRRAG